MNLPGTPHRPDAPVRYGSRYGSEPAAGTTPRCLVCRASRPARRARYCSDACRQRAYRLRQIDLTGADTAALVTELKRRAKLLAHRLFECPACGEFYLGVQRCADCNRFCRLLGLGGACPSCEQPILLAELLGLEPDH